MGSDEEHGKSRARPWVGFMLRAVAAVLAGVVAGLLVAEVRLVRETALGAPGARAELQAALEAQLKKETLGARAAAASLVETAKNELRTEMARSADAVTGATAAVEAAKTELRAELAPKSELAALTAALEAAKANVAPIEAAKTELTALITQLRTDFDTFKAATEKSLGEYHEYMKQNELRQPTLHEEVSKKLEPRMAEIEKRIEDVSRNMVKTL